MLFAARLVLWHAELSFLQPMCRHSSLEVFFKCNWLKLVEQYAKLKGPTRLGGCVSTAEHNFEMAVTCNVLVALIEVLQHSRNGYGTNEACEGA